MFLDDLRLSEPAAHKLIRSCFDLLGLISFFTYAGNEVRAWMIKKGSPAQKAAGRVHSDIKGGFIRAEVISYNDLGLAGDIQTARGKGLVRLEGKTYEVSVRLCILQDPKLCSRFNDQHKKSRIDSLQYPLTDVALHAALPF